ncbi:MAG: heme biosynthesis protein HemY, partial [Serpentinimonas sp.]|nr:heme biosynthesis protein HemY [Serpentinimonas sp.]
AVREAALLRASAWAIEARDAVQARTWWQQLPQGAARRIQALRLRLKLAQLERDSPVAIDAVRQLRKHKAFSAAAAASLLQTLVSEALQQTHDAEQLLRVWKGLDARERADAGLALQFLQQWVRLQPREVGAADGVAGASDAAAGHFQAGRRWRDEALQTLMGAYTQLEGGAQYHCIRVLQDVLPELDASWLAQLDAAQAARPADAGLQYLAGQALMQRQLWGKANQMLQQASRSLQDAGLRRRAWRALAQLAEQRGDEAVAQQAWKQAALCEEAGL